MSGHNHGGPAFERRVDLHAAYDKRNPDPRKNYGIHGVDMRMYLIGQEGVVQFVLYTNWHLPHVEAEFDARPERDRWLDRPMPADLGYHSKTPMYEGHEPMEDCDLLGCRCYYDGSGLNAERIYGVLLKEGSDGVWRELESYYRDVFADAMLAARGAA